MRDPRPGPVAHRTAFAQEESRQERVRQKESLPALATKVAFPNLRFDRPVAFAYPDDGSNLFFVVEQHTATIWSFPNDRTTSDKKLFLKLPDPINRGNEEGLLGLAFHPKYKENKQFFVYYSANDQGTAAFGRLAVPGVRAAIRASPIRRARSGSGSRPKTRSKTTTAATSRSGRTAISTSRSATAAPPTTRCRAARIPRDWFGSILRIDVDHPVGRQALRHPRGQPRPAGQKVRPLGSRGLLHRPAQRLEVQLRPPDRRPLGRRRRPEPLGDGPPDRERRQLRLEHPRRVPPLPAPAPAAAGRRHPRSGRRSSNIPTPPPRDRPDCGLSITGGYVYRGKKIPALVGVYVYGDFDSGRIWGLRYENGKLIENGELIDVKQAPKLNIASFGEDAQGELYILAFDGRIHELVPEAEPPKPPRRVGFAADKGLSRWAGPP